MTLSNIPPFFQDGLVDQQCFDLSPGHKNTHGLNSNTGSVPLRVSIRVTVHIMHKSRISSRWNAAIINTAVSFNGYNMSKFLLCNRSTEWIQKPCDFLRGSGFCFSNCVLTQALYILGHVCQCLILGCIHCFLLKRWHLAIKPNEIKSTHLYRENVPLKVCSDPTDATPLFVFKPTIPLISLAWDVVLQHANPLPAGLDRLRT